MKIVRKRKPKRKLGLNQGRNSGKSEVFGISASRDFWEYVTQRMAKDGTNRSETVVNACVECWQKPELASNPVGRPKEQNNE